MYSEYITYATSIRRSPVETSRQDCITANICRTRTPLHYTPGISSMLRKLFNLDHFHCYPFPHNTLMYLMQNSLPIFEEAEITFLRHALDVPVAASSTSTKPRCQVRDCTNIVQSKKLCKRHGGGTRCRMPGCKRWSQGRGLCRSHGGGSICTVEGCHKGQQKRGLCASHGGVDKCSVLGCKYVSRASQLCRKHGIAKSNAEKAHSTTKK